MAAQRVIVDRVPVMVAGGLESISLVQNEHMNLHRFRESWLEEHKPEIYMPMIETAEVVAKRYYVTREAQDEYALAEPAAHRRRPARRALRRRDRAAADDEARAGQGHAARRARRRSRSPRTRATGPTPRRGAGRRSSRWPARRACITAGNASQLSDGASACVVMDAKLAEQRGPAAARHLPRLRGRRLRARRDGHRPRVRGAAPARALRPQAWTTSTSGS